MSTETYTLYSDRGVELSLVEYKDYFLLEMDEIATGDWTQSNPLSLADLREIWTKLGSLIERKQNGSTN